MGARATAILTYTGGSAIAFNGPRGDGDGTGEALPPRGRLRIRFDQSRHEVSAPFAESGVFQQALSYPTRDFGIVYLGHLVEMVGHLTRAKDLEQAAANTLSAPPHLKQLSFPAAIRYSMWVVTVLVRTVCCNGTLSRIPIAYPFASARAAAQGMYTSRM